MHTAVLISDNTNQFSHTVGAIALNDFRDFDCAEVARLSPKGSVLALKRFQHFERGVLS